MMRYEKYFRLACITCVALMFCYDLILVSALAYTALLLKVHCCKGQAAEN
jgi:hypothetical protein